MAVGGRIVAVGVVQKSSRSKNKRSRGNEGEGHDTCLPPPGSGCANGRNVLSQFTVVSLPVGWISLPLSAQNFLHSTARRR